jgi:hypothetical protein
MLQVKNHLRVSPSGEGMPFSTAILGDSESDENQAEVQELKPELPIAGLIGRPKPGTTTIEPLLGLRTGEAERKQESTHGASF